MKLSRIFFVCIAFVMVSCQPKTDQQKLKSLEVLPDSTVIKRIFKPDGKLFAEILRKKGMKNGLSKNFYENGEVEIETNYVNDRKEGETKLYYPGGKICKRLIYKNDLRNGIEEHYYKNGKIACQIPYLNGEVEPGLLEYNSDGVLFMNNPSIVVTPIDKIATKNKYILQLTLSNHSKSVAFKRVYFKNEKKTTEEIKTQDGIGNLSFDVNPGKVLYGKIILEASYETIYGNLYVTRTTYNLVIGRKANK